MTVNGYFILQCLMMFQVPFMEDVRQYTFASLPGARKHFEPSGMLNTHVPLSIFTILYIYIYIYILLH